MIKRQRGRGAISDAEHIRVQFGVFCRIEMEAENAFWDASGTKKEVCRYGTLFFFTLGYNSHSHSHSQPQHFSSHATTASTTLATYSLSSHSPRSPSLLHSHDLFICILTVTGHRIRGTGPPTFYFIARAAYSLLSHASPLPGIIPYYGYPCIFPCHTGFHHRRTLYLKGHTRPCIGISLQQHPESGPYQHPIYHLLPSYI